MSPRPIVLALVIAGAGTVGAGAAAQAPGAADFKWTTPPRFGHYIDAKRLYPQSAGEVNSGPFPVEFALREEACRPGVERHWSAGGDDVDAEPAGDCKFRLSFEREGVYPVTLGVEGNGLDDSSTQRVVVQDFLIVAIGDSVASGEGNPDNGRFVHPTWQNPRCHRGALASTAQAARDAEDADDKSSVTFVHLACSGATVPEGLTDGYKGIQPGLFPRPRKLPAQLEELKTIAAKREVDAVLLSVGANDIGFSTIVRFCISHEPCYESRIKRRKLGVLQPGKKPLDEAARESLAQLPGRYATVDARLAQSLTHDRVYAIEYFDPTHATADTFCGPILRIPLVGSVSRDELQWAYRDVLVPLNGHVRAAADLHDWQYVGGVADAFAAHGYCARDPWVRQLRKSLAQQGLDYHGTLHPNPKGHRRTADLIDGLLTPALFPGGKAREPRSPEQQADQPLPEDVVPAEAAREPAVVDGDEDWVWLLLAIAAAVTAPAAAVFLLWRRRR
jgi:lysophospholipase L1-like esterase